MFINKTKIKAMLLCTRQKKIFRKDFKNQN